MKAVKNLIENINKVIIGKEDAVKLVLTALFAKGHILIEDVPGVGKTMLAKSLALSINANFKRIQFTPDLLPSDVTGLSVYNPKDMTFEFREGPVFSNILLADEINRATPRTQSSLLECMQEYQVTVDGKTYKMPDVFFVIATQNPIEQQGVYLLPEAQLDRFLMQIDIGYPNNYEEMKMMEEQRVQHPIEKLNAVAELSEIIEIQNNVKEVYIDETIKKYIVDITNQTRKSNDLILGASPRASLSLMKSAQAYALINGSNFVLPDFVKALCKPVLRHRLILKPQARISGIKTDEVIDKILKEVEVPIGFV